MKKIRNFLKSKTFIATVILTFTIYIFNNSLPRNRYAETDVLQYSTIDIVGQQIGFLVGSLILAIILVLFIKLIVYLVSKLIQLFRSKN